MKLWKRFAVALLAAEMVLALLTACGGSGPAPASWDSSRTKRYYQSHGVTGENVSLKAALKTPVATGSYVFTRDENNAYLNLKFVDSDQEMFMAKDGCVYTNDDHGETWRRYQPDSDTGRMASLLRAGYVLILPTDQNVAAFAAGNVTLKDETYYAETLKLDTNGAYSTYRYYYDTDGLAFVEVVDSAMTIEVTELSGTPDAALLQVPQKWRDADF